jgi:hypothetical protein
MRIIAKHVLWMPWLLFGAGSGLVIAGDKGAIEPLSGAHAHNDYLHERPLLDALGHGFASVEADIFLVDGKLLVGHARSELKPEQTLQKLYLDPLRERAKAHGGRIYATDAPFNLLIDIKSDGETTYAALAKVLAQYAGLISVVRDGKFEPKAVTAVISGERPWKTVAAETVRYVGIDGRLSDLDSTEPSDLVPWISDRWGAHFRWDGTPPMPPAERDKLRAIVDKAHGHGRRVRLWATPESTTVWRELRGAGVDLINTDDLAGLEKFLRAEAASSSKN